MEKPKKDFKNTTIFITVILELAESTFFPLIKRDSSRILQNFTVISA